MNKIIIAIIIVIVIALGGYWIFLSKPQPQSQPSAQPSLPSANPTSTTNNVVVYTDAGYSPSVLKIKVGATAVFQNNSSQAMWTASGHHPSHSDYSGTTLSEHCDDSNTAFDACKGTQPGSSWSFKFDKVGAWKYHNHLNPSDTGTIIVEQ